MLLRTIPVWLLTFALLAVVSHCKADETKASLTETEAAFAKALSNSVLVGHFTASKLGEPAPESGVPKLSRERYELGEIRKVADGQWLLPTRIRYGTHDVTLPITLPITWAGDTAVIVVDNIGFPGLGTYSARVLIHDGRYSGYWHGAGYGGYLFGDVVKQPVNQAAKQVE